MTDGSTPTQKLAEAIEAHAAAILVHAAAIRAVRSAEPTSETAVRAGEAEMPEPFGTAVALSEEKKERKDRSIDRSSLLESLFSIDGKEVDRPEIGRKCKELHAMLITKSRGLGLLNPETERYREENRRLVITAAVIARRFGEAGEEWLDRAQQTTKRSARSNPWGYFRRCLVNGLRELLGIDLPLDGPAERNCPRAVMNKIIRNIPVPEKWLAEPREGRISEAG